MSHKDYKEGMASQAKADSAAWRNAEWILKNLSDSDKKWKNRYGEIIDTTINILSEMELKEIYGISKQFDIADMEESERLTLIAVLYYLAKSNSSSTSYIKKSLQRMYISSIARYLKIANFPVFDIQKIKNIDSKKSEKAILHCVMEYLFLENFDHSYMETCKTIIDMFSVGDEDIDIIQKEIDDYVLAIGPDGLAGRYAFLASEKVRDKKPAELKVKVYYQIKDKHADGNKTLASKLKKAIEGCGNHCVLVPISKLDENTFDKDEYSIMLGDNTVTREYLSTSNTYHEILGDFGCSIKVDSSGKRIIVTNDVETEISDREAFIRYFETICTSPYESNNNDNKAKKLANKRKEKQEKKQKSKYQAGDTGLKIMDSTSWFFDFWDRANFGESIGGNILGLLAMIVSGIVYLPVMVSMLIVGGVVGISEAAIGALTEKLQDSNFDSKFVGVAQETITYVKTVEYVFNKQLETAE